MRIQQNTDVQIGAQAGFENIPGVAGAGKAAHKNAGENFALNSVSGASLTGESLIAQRQGLAKKQAMKVVSDAFGGEKKLDAQMQSIKDEIKRLQGEIDEKTADRIENNKVLKDLQEEYGIDPDSDENRKLTMLAAKMRTSNKGVSDEELKGLSEYQQKALYYVTKNQQNDIDIDRAKSAQAANVQGYSEMKSERAKSQDMLNAQNAADDILEASNDEAISLLTKEAVDHIDEEQKEREEEAKVSAIDNQI